MQQEGKPNPNYLIKYLIHECIYVYTKTHTNAFMKDSRPQGLANDRQQNAGKDNNMLDCQ
jgi:hypothetical protein